jgi:DNA topoisomerase-3
MTGQWERRLNEIARGGASDEQFMDKVKQFAAKIVEQVRLQSRAAKTSFESEEQPRGAGAKGRKGASRTSSSTSSTGSSRSVKSAQGSAEESPATTIKKMTSRTRTAAAQAASPDEGPTIITACPRIGCGGSLFMGRKGYGCSNYREGCKFVIWKQSFGRSLTDAQVKAIVEKGKTAKLKLALADGTPTEGRIVLRNLDTGELAVELDQQI